MKRKSLDSFFCPVCVVLVCITLTVVAISVGWKGEIHLPLRAAAGVCLALLLISVIGPWSLIIHGMVPGATRPEFSGGTRVGWIRALGFLNIFAIPVYRTKRPKEGRNVENTSTPTLTKSKQAHRRPSLLALASILMGAAFLVLVCYKPVTSFLLGLAGVYLGIAALYRIAMHRDRLRGKPYAIAGILTCGAEVLATVVSLHFGTYTVPNEDYYQLLDKAGIVLCNERGFSLADGGRAYDALQEHKQARKLAKKEAALACYGIGSSLIDLHEYDKALAALDKAIEYNPRLYDAYQAKADAYRYLGRFQDSLDACRVTIYRFPDYAETYCSMGQAYESLGNDKEAIDLQIEAMRRDPQWPYPQHIINEVLPRIEDEQYRKVVLQRLRQIKDPNTSLNQGEEFKAIVLPLSRVMTSAESCAEDNQDLPDEQTLIVQVRLLEEFIAGNPQSIWADDGKFILSELYFELPHEQAKWLRDLLINHPYVHIEQWTRDQVSSELFSNAHLATRARLLAYYREFGPKEQFDTSFKQFIEDFPGDEKAFGDAVDKLVDSRSTLHNPESIFSKRSPQTPLEQDQPGSTNATMPETL